MHQGNYQQGRRSEDLLQIHLHIAAHRLNLNSVVKLHRKAKEITRIHIHGAISC